MQEFQRFSGFRLKVQDTSRGSRRLGAQKHFKVRCLGFKSLGLKGLGCRGFKFLVLNEAWKALALNPKPLAIKVYGLLLSGGIDLRYDCFLLENNISKRRICSYSALGTKTAFPKS